jgi:hypothetical protein
MKRSELRQIIREEIENLQIIEVLENELGVKVIPSQFNPEGNRLSIYPNSTPDREFYARRNSQFLEIIDFNGNYLLSYIFGYDRSINPLSKILRKEPKRSNIVGMSELRLSSNKVPVTISQLKQFVDIMKKGLSDEASAQADFYKNRQPD